MSKPEVEGLLIDPGVAPSKKREVSAAPGGASNRRSLLGGLFGGVAGAFALESRPASASEGVIDGGEP